MTTKNDTGDFAWARRLVAVIPAAVGTVVWSHAVAGALRHSPEIALSLTFGALLAALVGTLGYGSHGRAALLGGGAGLLAAGTVAMLHPGSLLPALSLVPAASVFAAGGSYLSGRLPASLFAHAARRRGLALLWLFVAAVSVLQVSRLSTYMTDHDSDWFQSTRHPFYAKHECLNAYVYAAELDRRGESNVYDAAHYPGLNPQAQPHTEIIGMSPEDPYQYPPPFLLLPRAAIALTDDYQAIRLLWFGINVTLCMAAVLMLFGWIGGRVGAIGALLAPVVLLSFPVLHDFQYGQFHFAAIALAILGMLAFARRRPALGGWLLATAILAKVFPLFLLVPLFVQRRWRDLAWTAAAGVTLTMLALVLLGPAPFVAFFEHQLPRLGDGSAFAFDDAWPELASLVIAGNQGVFGIVDKLEAMGVPLAGAAMAQTASRLFLLLLLAVGVRVGLRTSSAGRAEQAVAWLGLIGLASLASNGAWADYVALTCVWLLALLAPLSRGRRGLQIALGLCAVFQLFLVGSVPLGQWTGAGWMLPVSLIGALAMLATFGGAAWMPSIVPVRIVENRPAYAAAAATRS